MKSILIVGLLLLACGCSSNVVVREVTLGDPGAAWARVLHQYVDAAGRIDFRGIAQNPRDLEGYLSYIAKNSPELFPEAFTDEDARLAFYLNVFHAVAIYNIIHLEMYQGMGNMFARQAFIAGPRYLIGGKSQSLSEYFETVIRPLNDPRVYAAINAMARGFERLRPEPFERSKLQQQLETLCWDFYNNPENVRVRKDYPEVLFSEILKWNEPDFLKHAKTLIVYVNRYRKEKIPEDDEIGFIDFDWRGIQQIEIPN